MELCKGAKLISFFPILNVSIILGFKLASLDFRLDSFTFWNTGKNRLNTLYIHHNTWRKTVDDNNKKQRDGIVTIRFARAYDTVQLHVFTFREAGRKGRALSARVDITARGCCNKSGGINARPPVCHGHAVGALCKHTISSCFPSVSSPVLSAVCS